MKILMCNNDQKARNWAAAMEVNGEGQIKILDNSQLSILRHLLLVTKNEVKFDAVCFRYLNDSKLITKSILKLIVDILVVIICKLRNKRILWICHNVDFESVVYYPRIIRFRRMMIKKAAVRVFVTDTMLIKHAAAMLDLPSSKIGVVTFGCDKDSIKELHPKLLDRLNDIKVWIHSHKEKTQVSVGLWIGEMLKKKLSGVEFALDLIRSNEQYDGKVLFVFVGDILQAVRNDSEDLYKQLTSSPYIYVLDEHLDIPNVYWAQIADFIWKPLDDYSLPFTLFKSAAVDLPLATMGNTFVASVVSEYNVGFSLSPQSNSDDILKLISQIEPKYFEQFRCRHSWSSVSSLFNSIHSSKAL